MTHLFLRLLAGLLLPVASVHAQQTTLVTPRANLSAEQWRADLRTLMQEMEKRHKNLYHTTSRAAFDSMVKDLDARIPSLARHEIIAEMMKIVASVGDGHTNIYPTRDTVIGFSQLPVQMYFFSDGLFIRSARKENADLVGARVLRIGDAPVDEAYNRASKYVGRDNDMGTRFWAPYLLAMPEMLHAMRLATSADSARFEVEIGGRKRTVWLKPFRKLIPTLPDADASWMRRDGWVDARTGKDPLWLSRRPDSTLWWFTRLPESRTAYAQINQVRNGETQTFEEFSDSLLAFVDTAGIDRLIIDLRLNRGGNGNLRMPLERGLLKRPAINQRGKLLVLIGRSTWSAAQFMVNDMLEYSEAIFVGEPTGSKGNAYGDSRQIRLPNSGITVRASIFFWQDWHPEDTRQWVAPEIAAEPAFADYRANRDVALDAARTLVTTPSFAQQLRSLVAADDTVAALSFATRYFADSVHKYANSHVMLDEVAIYFYNRKDIPRAAWVFRLAAARHPDVARAHINVAVMYQTLKKPELEARAWRRVLELEPGHPGASARLKELEP